MAQITASLTGISVASRSGAALLALMLGLFLIAGAGFVQADALHEGTHDTRHAFGLPCH